MVERGDRREVRGERREVRRDSQTSSPFEGGRGMLSNDPPIERSSKFLQ